MLFLLLVFVCLPRARLARRMAAVVRVYRASVAAGDAPPGNAGTGRVACRPRAAALRAIRYVRLHDARIAARRVAFPPRRRDANTRALSA